MFLDASAVVAILNEEEGWEQFAAQLSRNGRRFVISPLVRFEAILAVARASAKSRGVRVNTDIMAQARDLVDNFSMQVHAEQIAISAEIGDRAIDASIRFGKSVGHPADLNFGDCFAYACAKSLGVPLLYKGNDFAQTDLA